MKKFIAISGAILLGSVVAASG